MFDTFFNIAAVIVIVGAPLMWLAGWIMLTYKADRFIHRQFEPPPRVPTPEEWAASQARVRKMNADIQRMRTETEAAHHH